MLPTRRDLITLAMIVLSFLLSANCSVGVEEGDDNDMGSFSSTSGDVDRFFKLAYSMVEKADTKTLAIKLSPEYKKLCVKIGGCAVAEREVDSTLKEKINTLQIHWYKMERLQAVFNRIIPNVKGRRRSASAAAAQNQTAP